jgi:hypothetical protein
MKKTNLLALFGACTAIALSAAAADAAPDRAAGAAREKAGAKRAEAAKAAPEALRKEQQDRWNQWQKKREELGAAQEARKAKIEERRKAQEAKRAEATKAAPEDRTALQEKRAALREKLKNATPEERKAMIAEARKAREAKKAAAAEATEKRTDHVNTVTEKRQDNQEKRIEHGIQKGYLTSEETGKLEQQQQSIEKMQQQFNSDGKIMPAEAKQLRTALNEASFDIWSQKHDTDGKQMATYRLGKNVFLKPEVAARLEDENLSRGDARQFLGDFHDLCDLKRKLNGDLTDDQRAQLQDRYDDLLNLYFTTK